MPLPQVMNQGGAVIASPRLVPITFSGDPTASQFNQFVAIFAVSPELRQMTAEYGIGQVSSASPVTVASTLSASPQDSDIRNMLAAQLAAGTLGTPTDQAIYIYLLPQGTNVTYNGAVGCTDIDGYHEQTTYGGLNIHYAVILHCSGDAIGTQTSTTAHEVVEAATDPNDSPLAYYQVDSNSGVWSSVAGPELADMCAPYPDSLYTPADIGYQIQRTWSNYNAAIGNDPCVPLLPGEIYFNAAPTLTDMVTYTDPQQGPMSSLGVSIPVGGTRTIDVHLFSFEPTADWTVSAVDNNGNLSFSWDQTTGNNGTVLHLTIHVLSQDSTIGGEVFVIQSNQGSWYHYWPVIVTN